MFRLSFRLLSSRMKWCVLLSFVFSLVTSSVLSIFTATDNIKYYLQNYSFQQYGEFSGVLYNLSDDKKNILKKVKGASQFIIGDSLQIENKYSAIIGWVDQEFIELGHIKLLSGEFPMKIDEVAIESFYLEALDSTWRIGEYRDLEVGGKTKSLKLVGILENYSARWSVGIENYRFPNIFISESAITIDHSKNNYLIQYIPNNKIKENIDSMYRLIDDYGGNGFLNDRLFYYGLRDYDNTTKISFGIQFIIILVSSFSVLSMLSFFNNQQVMNFAIFKALGCTNKGLFLISVIQTSIIFGLGTLFSIPLLILLHFIIVRNTYGLSILATVNMSNILFGIIPWILLLFGFIVVLLHFALRKQSQSSIGINLRGGKRNLISLNDKFNQINFFGFKQLLIQLQSNLRDTVLSLMTFTFSILMVIFSFVMAKESAGIWNTQIDYYLTAQEIVGTKLADGENVVFTQGGVFHPQEVRKVEELDGIKYIDRVPYMLDVTVLMNEDALTPTLTSWINQYKNYDVDTRRVSFSSVSYVLLTKEEISKLYPVLNETQDSIIIHIPGLGSQEKRQLIGEKITFTKKHFKGGSYNTESWDFKILDVMGNPYIVNIDKERTIKKDGITVVLNENDIIKKGISLGYKDLLIYTDDNLPKEKAKDIYNKIYSLIAGVPGSLFQYIPDVIHNSTRITDYLELLGKIAFYISVVIAISSMFTLVFNKYQIQKRYWGIYRSLGMSSNTVFLYLLIEIFVYFIFAILINSVSLYVFLFKKDITYPAAYYIFFAFSTVVSTFFMLIAAALFLKQKIKKDSIAALLKLDE